RRAAGSAVSEPLFPLEDSLLVRVEPAEGENAEEKRHGTHRPQAKSADRQSPRKEEDGKRIEDDEDEGDEVEPDGELHPRLANGFGATLVILQLGGVGPPRAQDSGYPERDHPEGHDEPEINHDG